METLFEILDISTDEDALPKIKMHLFGNSQIMLCTEHARRKPGYTYGQTASKSSDTVAMTPFQYALAKEKWKCARYLLELKIQALFVLPKDFNTPLHEIARCNNQEFLDWFYNNAAIMSGIASFGYSNFDQPNHEQLTPLMYAVKNQKSSCDLMRFFNSFKHELNVKDNSGINLVHLAIEAKQIPFLETLLQLNVDLAYAQTNAGEYPVHMAARTNNLTALMALFNVNANLHVVDNGYCTALHYAAKHGYPEIMQFLLAKKVDVNATNVDQDTPAHLVLKNHTAYVSTATERPLEFTVSLLLKSRSDFYKFNDEKKSVYDLSKELCKSNPAKFKEFKQAIDNANNPVNVEIMVAHAWVSKASQQFEPQKYQFFCDCLNELVTPAQKAAPTSYYWKPDPNSSGSNLSNQNHIKKW